MRLVLLVISFFVFSLPSQNVRAAEAYIDTGFEIEFSKAAVSTDYQANEEILLAVSANLSNSNVARCRVSSDAVDSNFIFPVVDYKVTTAKATLLPSYHFSKSIGLLLIFPKHYFW